MTFFSTLLGTLAGSILTLVVFGLSKHYDKKRDAMELFLKLKDVKAEIEEAKTLLDVDNGTEKQKGVTQKILYVEYDYFALLSSLNRYLDWEMIKEITDHYGQLKLIELYRARFFKKEWEESREDSYNDYKKGIYVLIGEKSIKEDTFKKLKEMASQKIDSLMPSTGMLKITGVVVMVLLLILLLVLICQQILRVILLIQVLRGF